jgi:hypothetical protein
MVGWVENGLNSGRENVGLGLENGATAAFDLVGPVGQTTEEGTDLFTDLALGAEAGVGRHFGADPAPDVLRKTKLTQGRWTISRTVWGPSSSLIPVIRSSVGVCRSCGGTANMANGSGSSSCRMEPGSISPLHGVHRWCRWEARRWSECTHR